MTARKSPASDWPAPDRVGARWRPLPPDAPAPPHHGAARYLWWLVRRQRARVLYAAFVGSVWMCVVMLQPYLVSRGVDDGLQAADHRALAWWSVALLGTGALIAVLATLRHRAMTHIRMYAAFHTVEVLTRHTLRLGSAFARQATTGDLMTVSGSDVQRLGRAMTFVGPGVGAVFGYGLVVVLLWSVSTLLAGLVLLGVPLLALCVGPLMGRLRRVDSEYRELEGALTTRAVDLAAGLRVLTGIGGRELFGAHYRRASGRLRAEGYRVGSVNSWVEALISALPSVLLALVVWLAARMAASGEITVGELIAVYGYMLLLIVPVFFFVEGADQIVRGLVSARRVIRVLAAEPDPDTGTARLPTGEAAELSDDRSGLVVRPGTLLGLVPTQPAHGVTLLDRLGRYGDTGSDQVTWGGTPLTALPLTELRRRLLVAENEARLFAGALREVISPGDHPASEETIRDALRTAAAEDIPHALPDGLDSHVEQRGHNFSGGQRQRLRLARALLADPDVLLLVEPTSAVDAHTEALMARRLREARRGRTTVVVTTSPLLLDQTDEVAWLGAEEKVLARGRHTELLTREPDYRALVLRGPGGPGGSEGSEESRPVHPPSGRPGELGALQVPGPAEHGSLGERAPDETHAGEASVGVTEGEPR